MNNRKSVLRLCFTVTATVCGLAVLALWSVGKYDRKLRAELARDCGYYERMLGNGATSLPEADRQWATAYVRQNCAKRTSNTPNAQQ